MQPAQLPVLPVLLVLVFARGGECWRAAPADGVGQMEWDDRSQTPETHLAHSRGLAPGGSLQDPASPAPSDSPEHLWTLQQEGEGSRSGAGNSRGSIPQGLGWAPGGHSHPPGNAPPRQSRGTPLARRASSAPLPSRLYLWRIHSNLITIIFSINCCWRWADKANLHMTVWQISAQSTCLPWRPGRIEQRGAQSIGATAAAQG